MFRRVKSFKNSNLYLSHRKPPPPGTSTVQARDSSGSLVTKPHHCAFRSVGTLQAGACISYLTIEAEFSSLLHRKNPLYRNITIGRPNLTEYKNP